MISLSLILQALHLVAYIIMLVGSAVLLRRGYASAAVSMLLGAAVAMLMAIVNLVFMVCQMTRWIRGMNLSEMMIMVALIAVVGSLLFALGFLQLALMTRREG
jgi:hypothetical protein